MKRAIASIVAAGLLLGLFAKSTVAQTPAPSTQPGAGKVVGEDYFFNHQVRNGAQWHYIWDDSTINGYSKFGDVFKSFGATLAHCDHAPTAADLDKYSIYFIVNPSTVKNAAPNQPNYMDQASGDAIEAWVKAGGTLCVFMNDVNNTEFTHLDTLTDRFGIHFNPVLRNAVPSANDRTPGTFMAAVLPDHPIFKDVKAVYMKEICTITVKDPAQPLLVVDDEKHDGGKDVVIATAKVGKGFVFGVCDPWFYNEYIDLKDAHIPAIDNRKAATNFAGWILGIANPPIQP
jgi:unsaturated rhamnogalacturonyl hydrolase